MTRKIFIDTDVILDVALARQDFVQGSKMVLALAENYFFQGVTSSTIISNVYYILKKVGGDSKTRLFIKSLLTYIIVLPVDQNDIENAIKSEFADFEDAIQHSVAARNQCDSIVTRNISDFKKSAVMVCTPLELLTTYKEKL